MALYGVTQNEYETMTIGAASVSSYGDGGSNPSKEPFTSNIEAICKTKNM